MAASTMDEVIEDYKHAVDEVGFGNREVAAILVLAARVQKLTSDRASDVLMDGIARGIRAGLFGVHAPDSASIEECVVGIAEAINSHTTLS